ncbi:MAG: ABC transporter permease [Bacteroidales bacterium]|nr:ABC transporter permease [Bacteroidales bacterium]
MIRNYIVIALRNLWRNKMITLINLVGMAIGFGIFLTFWSWVRFDLSFDKFHDDIEQMYLLNVRITMNGSEYTSNRTGGIYAAALTENFSQIQSSCRVSQPQEFELGVPTGEEGDDVPMKYYTENEVLAVDSSFFSFFSFKLLQGNIDVIFSSRDHLVLTRSLATKLFGEQDPMDRTVRIGEGGFFIVAGVVEDPPEESSIRFQALMGFNIMEEQGYPLEEYGGTMYYNHFKLLPTLNLEALNSAINEHVDANFETDLESYYFLDSFERLYLHGESQGIIGFYMNLIMSLVILSIASINFINLTTASSSKRLKEIAVRKSAGASKKQLIIQFMGESYLLLLFSFYLGLFVAEHMVPATARAFGINLEANFSGASFWLPISLIFIITGLFAGLYPAVKIARFKPLAFLSGKSMNNYHRGSRSRKVLIVVQFTFSVIFIIVSVFSIRQFAYLKEADLGFNREDVVYIPTKGLVWDQFSIIKKDLAELHFVEGVTSGSEVPVKLDFGEIVWGEREGEHNKIARILVTDTDFLSTFEIGLLEGEYFSEERDSLNYEYVVVNQGLVDMMGWEDPVGRSFFLWDRDLRILGVTENFNFFPFSLKVLSNEALIYMYEDVREFIFVRVRPGIAPEQMVTIGDVFRKYNPGYAFDYDFVSEFEYEALENTDGIKLVFKIFSILAIFIATMGLIGLSIFNNNRRTKEVGIRKAMGAHSGIIMKLLLSEFMKLVLLSNLIAIPVAYLILKKIFQIFSYSVDLKLSVFVLVFLLSAFLSLITVTYQAFRTARSNPVDSLRYE